ncbi:capsule biosynthesis protein [Paracoccus tegillarcae]|uniref:Capsule biosynthesis protein n=1 Tax=Paracoccus tegillarcae TaxID=1529068 RepID=A0A2K9EJ74_9RHOB|nr:capsule biosynthesis protein [Paracoccus tegillarcae]AUH34429.1 capsule biosynthesis protein [Paracoccus tegillarcae]
MTTPPRARRFHIDRVGTGFDDRRSGQPSAAEPAQTTQDDTAGAGDPPKPGTAGSTPFSSSRIAISVRKKNPDEPANDVDTRGDDGRIPSAESLMQSGPIDDGFGDRRFPTAEPAPQSEGDRPANQDAPAASATTAAAGTSSDDHAGKIAAIKAENLTVRQLRIARRIAALHQIEVESDEEAVLLLRERGIDPSHRTAVGRVLSAEGARAQAAPSPNAPTVLSRPSNLPAAPKVTAPARPEPKENNGLRSREELTEDKRAAEIYLIQRDIARRRRRRLAMVFIRLAFFVFLPTAIAGWYYYTLATPLYATKSQFQIQQANGAGGSEAGGMLAGMQMATNPDSIAVQSYLTSRDAMLRLDRDMGFKRAFQDPLIDPVQRLSPDASNEAAYKVYQKSVKIGYDPTEGMINMEVIAPDPQLSEGFSLALIEYAEGQVDQMTSRLRDDQMTGAMESYQDAEQKVLDAQRQVQKLQQELGVLDPAAEGGVVMQQISQLEIQLNTKELELGSLLANPRPQQSRVDALNGEIGRLQEMITQTRQQLTQGNETRSSLAAISGELRIAEGDLSTRQELLAQSAAQLETARIEANKQVRYLSMSVSPTPPDEPTYPKAFQNTLVAFLVFSGIYLMMSLTASILREQVSS